MKVSYLSSETENLWYPLWQDVLFMQKVMFNQLNSDSVTKLYVNCIPVDIYILIFKKKEKRKTDSEHNIY